MSFLLITAMTLLAIVTFLWVIGASQHTNLYSLRNLFLAVWLYYGFSIGIDLITGAEIPYTSGEIYMMDPANWPRVSFVMWCYLLCGISFLVTYAIMQGKRPSRPLELRYSLSTPPELVIVLIHAVVAYFYVQIFFGLDRMERLAMAQQYPSYKFAQLLVPLTLSMDIIMVLCGNNRKSMICVVLALLLALVTGNRSYVMLVVLVGTFHWRPKLQGWKLIGIVGSCGFMVFAFKTLYAVGLAWYVGQRVDMAMIYDNLHMTLSGLDADASYAIASFYTGHESPLWLGKSYVKTPILLAWPRFLGGIEVTTLAEDYVWSYHIATAKRGGALAFSAIAEAWLNFSYCGPVLLGVFWGAVANLFDNRSRGIAYFIVVLMVARLFRSDTASLVKNWVLVWGTMFVIAMILLTIYSVVVEPKTSAMQRRNLANGNLPNDLPNSELGGLHS